MANLLIMVQWTPEEVTVFCAKTREAIRDKNVHAYQVM